MDEELPGYSPGYSYKNDKNHCSEEGYDQPSLSFTDSLLAHEDYCVEFSGNENEVAEHKDVENGAYGCNNNHQNQDIDNLVVIIVAQCRFLVVAIRDQAHLSQLYGVVGDESPRYTLTGT